MNQLSCSGTRPFHKAGGSDGKRELSNEARRNIEEVAGREMAEMGYRA